MKETLLAKQSTFHLYRGFHLLDFLETSYPSLTMHAVYKIHVWVQLVNNERNIIWKRKNFTYLRIWAFKDASFRKLRTSHRSFRRYWRCDLVSDRSIMKGKAVSRLPFERFFWKPTLSSLSAMPTKSVRLVSIGPQRSALFIWEAKYLHSSISASIRGNFLQLHTHNPLRQLIENFVSLVAIDQ